MSEMRAIIIYFCAGLLMALGSKADGSSYEFGVGGKPLICVPKSDVPLYNRSSTHSSLSLVAEMRPVEILTFQYSAPEVLKAISPFHVNRNYRDDESPNALFGNVSLISDAYKRVSLGMAGGPNVKKIWERTGECKEPIIVRVPNSSTYLAKCDREDFWHILFDRRPGTGPLPHNIYDSVLAECTHNSVGFGPHQGVELENCVRRIIVGSFRVDYSFQIDNANLISQMDTFLRSKIDFWKRNCSRE